MSRERTHNYPEIAREARRTGNYRAAARSLGIPPSTVYWVCQKIRTRRVRISPADETRFLTFVAPHPDGCWYWMGTLQTNQWKSHWYGRFSVRMKNFLAHRVAYSMWVGPLVAGLVIDHVCHNPTCVNPDHLRQVTQAENMRNKNPETSDNGRSIGNISKTTH